MKKILMIIMLLSSMSVFADCSERYEKRVDVATKSISFVLNCDNKVAVRTSVDKLGRRLGSCEDKGIVCTVIAKGGVYLVRKQIPLEWECKPDIAMKVLEVGISKACEAITGL